MTNLNLFITVKREEHVELLRGIRDLCFVMDVVPNPSKNTLESLEILNSKFDTQAEAITFVCKHLGYTKEQFIYFNTILVEMDIENEEIKDELYLEMWSNITEAFNRLNANPEIEDMKQQIKDITCAIGEQLLEDDKDISMEDFMMKGLNTVKGALNGLSTIHDKAVLIIKSVRSN